MNQGSNVPDGPVDWNKLLPVGGGGSVAQPSPQTSFDGSLFTKPCENCAALAKLAEDWRLRSKDVEQDRDEWKRVAEESSHKARERDEWKRRAEETLQALNIKGEEWTNALKQERDALAAALRKLYDKCNQGDTHEDRGSCLAMADQAKARRSGGDFWNVS